MAIYDKDQHELNIAYDVEAREISRAYDIQGQIVYQKSKDYANYSIADYLSVALYPVQGFDIFNGIIFQFMGSGSTGNRLATINVNTQQIINNNISSASDHGDSASFSSTFYATTDVYPLLYVTSDTNPAKVYVNRVTENTSQLITTYAFPLDKTGYYAALCLDDANNRMYMVGYSEQNYQTDDGGNNKTVVSIWDMSTLTDNGDGTYTPAFVSSYERPFIYTMQGQQYHDGMLWISSGGTNVHGYVYALDPSDGTLLYTIDTNTTTEVEGIAFLPDGNMVFGLQGGTYKKVTFADAV